jgi:hypothetical protein
MTLGESLFSGKKPKEPTQPTAPTNPKKPTPVNKPVAPTKPTKPTEPTKRMLCQDVFLSAKKYADWNNFVAEHAAKIKHGIHFGHTKAGPEPSQ